MYRSSSRIRLLNICVVEIDRFLVFIKRIILFFELTGSFVWSHMKQVYLRKACGRSVFILVSSYTNELAWTRYVFVGPGAVRK